VNAPAPVHAGVDGEAVDLSPPLRFAIRLTAPRVRISPRHPGASPSARLHLPGYPTRVLAHFLGTVVAYETLHAHRDLHAYLLVTLGHCWLCPGAGKAPS
jgi:hypothetical protein